MDSTEPKARGDETLNVEDRVEVTAFVERKAWILEKIKVWTTLRIITSSRFIDALMDVATGGHVAHRGILRRRAHSSNQQWRAGARPTHAARGRGMDGRA